MKNLYVCKTTSRNFFPGLETRRLVPRTLPADLHQFLGPIQTVSQKTEIAGNREL